MPQQGTTNQRPNTMLKDTVIKTGVAMAIATSLSMCTPAKEAAQPQIIWETLGNRIDEQGEKSWTQRFTIVADGPFDRLAFKMFKSAMKPVDRADTVIEILPGYVAIGSPRFAGAAPGDTIVVDIVTAGALTTQSFRPDGMHLVAHGKPVAAMVERRPITMRPEQWRTADGHDSMVYGDEAYAVNDSLRSGFRAGAYMQIPTPKSVTLGNGMVNPGPVKVVRVDDDRVDYYRAEIGADTITVMTNSGHPDAIVAMLERRLEESSDAEGNVPEAVIEDWADYRYRGFMLDVSRNFIGKDDVKRIIDLMARYGLNTLHFHLGDDEGWRLEIPAIPELTSVGARRGYAETDDVPYLKGSYSGDGNPDSGAPASGYYSVDDYVELLKYADSKGIAILPEFDTPGHSRAAIRALDYRARHAGDSSMALVEQGDTSRYVTAQDYTDNIINPAIEGPYRFLGVVMDGIKDIYAKAGVELPGIHIGGDEVADYAWDGSPAVATLKAEKGIADQRGVHAYFNERVARLAAERGIKIAGWEEIALDHSPAYDDIVRPVTLYVNRWTYAGKRDYQTSHKGYPVVLSNVDYLYFDMKYTGHPEEPGLMWGGIVDEFRPLHATREEMCPGAPAAEGISGTLFAETVRSRAMVERYLLPRILGLAERAHNASATIGDADYFGLVTAEMPRWAAEGHDFFVRQPGIKVSDGMVTMNTAYADGMGEIRYTLDGSEPTETSTLYTGPFSAGDAAQIRARVFMAPAQSVTSILCID